MKFVLNKPIETKEPTIVVDAGLAIGKHVFRLVVEDELGVQSQPTDAVVVVTLERNPFPNL